MDSIHRNRLLRFQKRMGANVSKWKCGPCGGNGHEGSCIWCGGTGRPSFQQAYMLGLSHGQARGEKPFNRNAWQWIGSLLDILNDYGSLDALDAAFPGDSKLKFSKVLKRANEGNVEAVMRIVHRMRTDSDPESLKAIFMSSSIVNILSEISPPRGF